MVNRVFPQHATVNRAALLAGLAVRINTAHRLADKAGPTSLEQARLAGELLREAKRQVKHGEWADWCAENVEPKERARQVYMQIARRWPELQIRSTAADFVSIRDALAALADDEGDADDDLARLRAELEEAQLEQREPGRRARELLEEREAAWARAGTRLRAALRCFRLLEDDELLGAVEQLLVRVEERAKEAAQG